MKTARSLIVFLTMIAICAGSSYLRAEDWKTTDGKVYQDIKVVSSTPESVTILHKDGGAKVPLTNLSPEIQKRFNYDPDKAKAYADEQTRLSHPAPKQPASSTVASTTGISPARNSAPSPNASSGSSSLSKEDLKTLESLLTEDQVDAIMSGNAPDATSPDATAQATTPQSSASSSPKVYPSTDPNHHSEDDLIKSITGLRHDLSDPTYHTMAHFALTAQSLGPDPNDKNHHTMDEISGN